MSTLALLRDLAGCRAVLHDANEEARGPEVLGRLKAVLDEVVAALGGGEAQHIGWSSRRVTTWSTGGDPRWYEPDYHAWRAMRLREARAQLNRDWLAWDSNTRVARGRWWNPQHPAGPFNGIDRTVADGPGLADWLPETPLAFGVDRGGGNIHAAVAAIDRLGAASGMAYVNPRTYAQLQEQQRSTPARERALEVIRRSVNAADGTFEVSREDFYHRVSFVDTPPASARNRGTAVVRSPGPGVPARGYRPRWAPLLASELASLLPPRFEMPDPRPDTDSIEARVGCYANLIMGGPAAGIPDIDDSEAR